MIEVRRQVGVTKAHGQRVGIIHYREQLVGRRLRAAAEVEQTDVGVVVEVVEEHRAGCPVQTLVIVRVIALCLVVGIGMDDGYSQLRPCLVFLVHESGTSVLHDGTVQDAVGISVVEKFGIGGDVLHAIDGECVAFVTVIDVLEGGGLAVTGIVAAFEVEVAAKGFGVDDAASYSLGVGGLVDALVHGVIVRGVPGSVIRIVGEGTVVPVQVVLGNVPVNVCRYCPSRHAQPLAEEEEAPRLHAGVVSGIQGETVIGLAAGSVGKFGFGVEDALLDVVSAAEVELRLEEDGCVLRELMLQAHSEAVAVGETVAGTVGVGDES